MDNTDGHGGTRGGRGDTPSPAGSPSRLPPATPATSPPPPPVPEQEPAPTPAPGHARIPRSRWWYLLPIFLDIVGGVIAYFVLRQDDPQKARNCLLLGITLFVIHVAAFLCLLLLFPE